MAEFDAHYNEIMSDKAVCRTSVSDKIVCRSLLRDYERQEGWTDSRGPAPRRGLLCIAIRLCEWWMHQGVAGARSAMAARMRSGARPRMQS